MADCAFVGLGVMGYPMAGHLVAASHTVSVYNRTQSRARAWTAEHDGTSESSPALAARGADFVFTCVGNDDDVRAVTLAGGGVLESMTPGSILVDHTTASAGLAQELHAAASERGIGFLDAPISGGQAGAENATLTVMCGGDTETFDRAKPVIDAYAKAVRLLGGPGSGQRTKMVNQICIAGLVQGLAEGIDFARRAGLDAEQVLETISQGAAGSWQMSNRGVTMARREFDFGFALDWMRKDLAICFEEAQRIDATLPVTAIVDQFYARLQRRGRGRWDTSSLIELLVDD